MLETDPRRGEPPARAVLSRGSRPPAAGAPPGGCSAGGGERPRHQNRRRLWAGAALAGSLRRAASKDGQRVRRRLRPRSPLARGPAPGPEPPPEVGAQRPAARGPRADRERASAGGRGRAASGARGGGAETMAARAPGRLSAGPPAAPSHTCGASGAEGPGHPARRAAGGGLGVPAPGPGRGGARAGSGPGRGGAETPGTAGRGAPLSFLAFLPPERDRAPLFQDLGSPYLSIISRLASRSCLKAKTVEWGSNRGRPLSVEWGDPSGTLFAKSGMSLGRLLGTDGDGVIGVGNKNFFFF